MHAPDERTESIPRHDPGQCGGPGQEPNRDTGAQAYGVHGREPEGEGREQRQRGQQANSGSCLGGGTAGEPDPSNRREDADARAGGAGEVAAHFRLAPGTPAIANLDLIDASARAQRAGEQFHRPPVRLLPEGQPIEQRTADSLERREVVQPPAVERAQ